MKRYYFIKEIINDILIKNNGLEHSANVANMACLLAKLKSLDLELAAIIGICHDLATYKFKSSFDHANRSSMLAREILADSNLFNHDEIILITTAIKNHSFKDRIDDEAFQSFPYMKQYGLSLRNMVLRKLHNERSRLSRERFGFL